MDSKYVVFKREDFEQMLEESPEADWWVAIVDDAVVIRLQDIFAQSALFAYAAAIRTSIEIMQEMTDLTPDISSTLARMSEISDYFMRRGEEAGKHSHKIPD